MRYDEAKALLERELHNAFMNGITRVYVLHGIGEGILKQMTLETGRKLDFIRIPSEEISPNPGVTVLDLLVPDDSTMRRYVK